MPVRTPVLFNVFNRPETTEISFEVIRKAQPSRLYVSADGPRSWVEGEKERCELARSMTENIDWPCEVIRLYSEDNLGCGKRLSSAITDVLKEQERVIVMEDDCVAEQTFFSYCDQLLDIYSDDQRVMTISGNNFQKSSRYQDQAYYFSKYQHLWGWATWRRSWQHYDFSIEDWPTLKSQDFLAKVCESSREAEYWGRCFDRVMCGAVDTWDYQWILACWRQHGLCVLPSQNLVRNIGFSGNGTHTTEDSIFDNLPTFPISRLSQQNDVFADKTADRYTDEIMFSGVESKKEPRNRWISTRTIRNRLKRRVAA